MSVIFFIIHGIGRIKRFPTLCQKGVHRKLTRLVSEKVKKDSERWGKVKATELVDFETLYWTNFESDEQNNLYRKIYPDPFGTQNRFEKLLQLAAKLAPVRSLSIRLIGDVFGYLGRFQEPIKREVFAQVVSKLEPRLESGETLFNHFGGAQSRQCHFA